MVISYTTSLDVTCDADQIAQLSLETDVATHQAAPHRRSGEDFACVA